MVVLCFRGVGVDGVEGCLMFIVFGVVMVVLG